MRVVSYFVFVAQLNYCKARKIITIVSLDDGEGVATLEGRGRGR